MVGTALLLLNLVGTTFAARGWTANIAHLLVAYVWMVVPAVAAPLIVFATGHLPTNRVEAAAAAGLVAGWILQIVIGAFIPGFYRMPSGLVRSDGSWLSVVLTNLGVVLIWVAPLVTESAATSVTAAACLSLEAGRREPDSARGTVGS